MSIHFRSEIKLGDTYRDTITDFEGVATDIAFNINKCNRIYLQPKASKGKMMDGSWFDAPTLMHVATEEMLENGTQVDDFAPELALARPGGPPSKIK